MFAETSLLETNQEVISLEREQSTALMKQIFETLSEGVIKFSWKQADAKAEMLAYEFLAARKD